jgi:hypothetical protein
VRRIYLGGIRRRVRLYSMIDSAELYSDATTNG